MDNMGVINKFWVFSWIKDQISIRNWSNTQSKELAKRKSYSKFNDQSEDVN